MNGTPSNVIQLSADTTQRLRHAAAELNRLIPDIDRIADCDGECQEIAQMAAALQTKINKYIHYFGSRPAV